MNELKKYAVWLVAGSQDLYGGEVLRAVDAHTREMVEWWNEDPLIPCRVDWKPVVLKSRGNRPHPGGGGQRGGVRGGNRLDAHLFPRPKCGSAACRGCANPCSISTPSTAGTSPGKVSTWNI